MRIKSLKSGSSVVKISDLSNTADAKGSSSNWVTIITGANGTRKSLLLRQIASASRGFSRAKIGDYLSPQLSLEKDKRKTARVIAIAGTPFDRFVRGAANAIRSDEDNYSYFGFKSLNGSIGPSGINRVIGSLLWRHRDSLPQRIDPLCSIFNFLSIQPYMAVRLRRNRKLNAASQESNDLGVKRGNLDPNLIRPFLEAQREKLQSESNENLLLYVNYLLRSKARLSKLEKWLTNFPNQIEYDFTNGNHQVLFPIDDEWDLESLIDLGVLGMDDLFIRRELPDGEFVEISASSLSSGQSQLMLGLVGLGIEIEDDSLVLIDEPENSLHPEWQRQYIQLLEQVLGDARYCHIVIATHSPLVTSGVNGQRGNLIRLVPDSQSKFGIVSEPLAQNFGWSVNETLERLFEMQTTRGSGFVDMADQALQMIRDKRTETEEFRSLVRSITESSKNLPENDPALQVVRAIAKTIHE
ncbi:AAA family ATPase [Herbaspirillum sp.]|uniref:AAA family ATPase n=1 Tax=Herbaspirillum sp. TaxID=1890675 RepID=UPI0031DF0C9A